MIDGAWTMKDPIEIIPTARLILRSPLPSDLPILYDHVFADATVMRHAFAGQPLSLQQATEFFEENFDHNASGTGLAVLTERVTTEVIGFAGLLSCDVLGEADYEIGFVLRRSAWGNGYATEIGKGQLEYGFSVIGCRRLLAQTSPKNSASITALKKLGMKFHSTVENHERGIRQVYVAHDHPKAPST
jgi:[ribosomal protein S5]-alanine N-acetyltransferase